MGEPFCEGRARVQSRTAAPHAEMFFCFKTGVFKRPNIDYKDPSGGFTALHHAALTGSLDIVVFLIESGATVDAGNSIGRELIGMPWAHSLQSTL